MPNSLTLETSNKKTPLLLICGDNSATEYLINEYKKDFKIAHVSDSPENQTSENYYRIAKSSLHHVNNLEEKIDYSVIFLNNSEDKDLLLQIVNKLSADKSKTLIILDIDKRETFFDILIEYKKYENIKFAFCGEIFGTSSNFYSSDISKIIQSAILNKDVSKTSDISQAFCINEKDFILGINHILFSHEQKNKYFYLFYKTPQTYNAIIHLLSRLEPELFVRFDDNTKTSDKTFSNIENEITSKIISEPFFLDKYLLGFEKRVGQMMKTKSFLQVQNTEKVEDTKKIKKLDFGRIKLFPHFAWALLFFIAINALLISLSVLSLKQSKTEFANKNFEKSHEYSSRSILLINPVKPSIELFYGFLSLIKTDRTYSQDFNKEYNALVKINMLLSDVENAKKELNETKLNKILSEAYILFFDIQNINIANFVHFPNVFSQEDFSKVLSISVNLPQILGFDKDKTYLLLFQNNGELRPTGGFIGSVGEITFSKGKIKDFHIEDVYSIDGQLKAHVEPHYIIRRYLQPHLYLRDSNFSPNFSNSASSSALLYNLATRKKVDGVIGITFEGVREIIKTIGPIKLSAYNITLDEKNTFNFLQDQIESNKFPGSSKKKEVLNALFNNLSLKFESDKSNFYRVGQIIPSLVFNKDIIFSFSNNSIHKGFSASGLAADFFDTRIKTQENVYDSLSINEANIGVNKANVQIQRDVVQDVFLKDNSLSSKTTLNLKSIKKDAPNYKAYVRILVPENATLNAISIDGVKKKTTNAITDFKIYEAKKFIAPKDLEVDTAKEGKLTSFGFITEVIAGKNQVIEVEYENKINPTKDLFTYSLLFTKQPGTQGFPFTLRLHYNDGFIPQNITNATLEKNVITIKEEIGRDKEFNIKLITSSPK